MISVVLNVLVLGGSIYLMLVYDSVLPSRSIPTLFGLFALVTFVYIFQGVFDKLRQRILSDIGNSLDQRLAPRVNQIINEMSARGARGAGDGLTPMRDLDSVRTYLSGQGPTALIDLPAIIFFLIVLSFLHVFLALTALLGALVLVAITLVTDRITRSGVRMVAEVTAKRSGMAESQARHIEVLRALGMEKRMRGRWLRANLAYLAVNSTLSNQISLFGGAGRTFRMFLQSGILTVGALLVINGEASGGVIFASSMISGRALGPVDAVIANWRSFSSARTGWARLKDLFARYPEPVKPAARLPAPRERLEVTQLYMAPPGVQRLTLQGVEFKLEAGQALAVIGPSAAGKTTLARAILGIWPPARGTVRLDGASIDQWDRDDLGASLGYLPQTVELLEGTVAENIARFDPNSTTDEVIAAARSAGLHDMILHLPQGYDTPVGSDGSELSAGQRQRIGLARALYGDPFLVLLDEPNSNLDAEGEAALENAIVSVRERGGIAILIAHRPAALRPVTHVLFLRDGRAEAFGPRDAVLKRIAKSNAPEKLVAPEKLDAPDASLTTAEV